MPIEQIITDGFDLLDLTFQLEKRLAIKIPKFEVRAATTIGDFHQFICSHTKLVPATNPCPTARAFHALSERIRAANLHLHAELTPTTPTAALLPKEFHRSDWNALGGHLDLKLPRLDYGRVTNAVVCPLFYMLPLAGIVLSVWAVERSAWFVFLFPPIFCTSVAMIFVLDFALSPLRCRIPRTMESVAGIAYLLAFKDKSVPQAAWTSDEIWAAIQYTIAEYVGTNPRRIRRKTTFVEVAKM